MSPIKLRGVPVLRIDEVATAKQFFVEFLGFAVDWEHYYAEGAPVYMQVSRGGMILHLSENPRFTRHVIVFVETRGIEELREELDGKSNRWSAPPVSTTPWKTKQMEIEDPFGNLLRFNEPVDT